MSSHVPLDEFAAFDFSDDFYESDIVARSDAATTFLSLPVELLLEISQYCKFKDIYSLTTVNKILHAVSIKRFYSVVAVQPQHFLSRLAGTPGITKDSSVTELLPLFTCRRSNILRGLFARTEHLHSPRTLILCTSPNELHETEFALLSTIMREIVNGASGLRLLRLPASFTTPVRLEGGTLASTLPSLDIHDLSLETSRHVVQNLHSLTELNVRSIGPDFLAASDPAAVYSRITKLSCLWRLNAYEEKWSWDEALYKELPRIMPNLQHLSVIHNHPEYEIGPHYHCINWKVLEGYNRLVQNLKHLRHFTLQRCIEPTYDSRGSGFLNDEVQTVKGFAALRPALELVTIQNHNPRILFDRCYPREWRVTWKRATGQQKAQTNETEAPAVSWTPDPAIESRWWWWFGVFGEVDAIRRVMVRHWKGETSIPSIDDLRAWESRNWHTMRTHLWIA